MLCSWSNRLARRLRSQGPVEHSDSSAMEKFINLPLELHLEIVSHLFPDDLIKLIRILDACDPSNSVSISVDIIERPSDLKRRSFKPIRVIFITSLFNSMRQYDTLVKRCQKSLNFVLMRGDTQCSLSLEWLPVLLTYETIGHRTKIHVSGRVQTILLENLVITSCGLYSESLISLAFNRCGRNSPGEFKLGGKLTRESHFGQVQ